MAGLFTCLCQYLVLKTLVKEVPALASEVGNFTDTVVRTLNNASEQWAIGANSVINDTNTQINQDVFGWVNTTTSAINETLNTFSDEMIKALNATFGGTILYEPVVGVFECLVGLKVAGIEKGLTWVSDHAHVEFPEFDKDVFSLGAAASLTNSSADDSFLASPGSEAADDITGAVIKVGKKLEGVVLMEAKISGALVGIYLFVVLVGAVRMAIGMLRREKSRAEGGGRTYTPNDPETSEQQNQFPSAGSRSNTRPFPAFGEPESSIPGGSAYPRYPGSATGTGARDNTVSWGQAPPYVQTEKWGEVRAARASASDEKTGWEDDGLGRVHSTYGVLGGDGIEGGGNGDGRWANEKRSLPRRI